MSWLSSWMHPGDAYKQAGKKEQAGYDEAQGIRQPWINNGIEAGKGQMDMYNKLMHPEQLQDEWNKNYTQSQYAQDLTQQNQTSGMDAASAMGLGGSSAALNNIQKGAGHIAEQDRHQYMDDMMKKFMTAIGLGSDIYGHGANQASQGASGAQSHGEWQGNNTFNEKSAGANRLGDMGESIAKMIAAYFSGGTSLATPGGNPWNNPDNNSPR